MGVEEGGKGGGRGVGSREDWRRGEEQQGRGG